MELERVKFVLKYYLRVRLAKIERHLIYVIEKDLSNLLSQAEMQFAFSLYEARKTHFKDNLFDQIPKKLNFMDQESIPDQYMSAPNCQQMVFIKILKEFTEHFEVMPDIVVELRQN